MTPRDKYRKYDMVAYDENQRPILVVEVKRLADHELKRLVLDTGHLVDTISSTPFPFFMLATLLHITIYESVTAAAGRDERWRLAGTVETSDVVKQYDSSVELATITEEYLAILLDAWLNDIAYSWKTEHPVGRDIFVKLGLVEFLRSGQRVLS